MKQLLAKTEKTSVESHTKAKKVVSLISCVSNNRLISRLQVYSTIWLIPLLQQIKKCNPTFKELEVRSYKLLIFQIAFSDKLVTLTTGTNANVRALYLFLFAALTVVVCCIGLQYILNNVTYNTFVGLGLSSLLT